MKKHVRVRGRKIPVKTRRIRGAAGLAYKSTKVSPERTPRIEIHSGLRGVNKISTLVHEMIHHLNIGLSERTVLALEEGIVEMVRDNPEVFYELAGARDR